MHTAVIGCLGCGGTGPQDAVAPTIERLSAPHAERQTPSGASDRISAELGLTPQQKDLLARIDAPQPLMFDEEKGWMNPSGQEARNPAFVLVTQLGRSTGEGYVAENSFVGFRTLAGAAAEFLRSAHGSREGHIHAPADLDSSATAPFVLVSYDRYLLVCRGERWREDRAMLLHESPSKRRMAFDPQI